MEYSDENIPGNRKRVLKIYFNKIFLHILRVKVFLLFRMSKFIGVNLITMLEKRKKKAIILKNKYHF